MTLILLLLAACAAPDSGGAKDQVDNDSDGYSAAVDCDDAHATVNPDAAEICDGLDNNCDGGVDVDATDASSWYEDDDEDGFGDPATAVVACDAPAGLIADGTDCDDTHPDAHPGGTESCDGYDNDCDGAIDDFAVDPGTWYGDGDGDGYGDAAVSVEACDAPAGYVADADDCDDTRSDIHPGADEPDCTDPTDYDCDGLVAYADADADGYAACEDCDDTDAGRNPGAEERCAEGDEDCDSLDGDADPSVSDPTTWYRDADADGYSSGSGASIAQCAAPIGYTAVLGDCDDYDALVNPGASEVCDDADVDEDCDGLSDDGDPSTDAATWGAWYADRDSDGFGDAARPVQQCEAPEGYVGDAADCDDDDAAVSPAATEICDDADVDEDCDGVADDADASVSGGGTWYLDADGDGYGGATTAVACLVPAGYVETGGDCDDASAAVSPAATEICDDADVDEDCDGVADDADASATGQGTWYADADGDGYAGDVGSLACDMPAGSAASPTDCDDGDVATSPAGVEVCGDGIDQDCSGADEPCAAGPYAGEYPAEGAYTTRLSGLEEGDEFGAALAAGDFDGDGLGDLVATARIGDAPSNPDYGVVYGWYGPLPEGEEGADDSPAFVINNDSSTYAGNFAARLVNVGDVSGDGRDDLYAFYSLTSGGIVYGGDTGTQTYSSADDLTGSCNNAARGGVLDGTGTADDWLCGYTGSSSSRGLVSLYSAGTWSGAIASLTGEAPNDYAGSGLGGAHDVDGDGVDDVFVGADGNDAGGNLAGAVYLLYGPISGSVGLASADVKIIATTYEYFGWSLDSPGDLDDDGHADLVVGAYGTNSYAGAVYVYTAFAGAELDAATGASAVFEGEGAGDNVGVPLATGDINGDGAPDLVLAAADNSLVSSLAGAVGLAYGPFTGTYLFGTDTDAVWRGTAAYDAFGMAVAVVPDVDGDGDDELAIGATAADSGTGSDQGAVWVWPGEQ